MSVLRRTFVSLIVIVMATCAGFLNATAQQDTTAELNNQQIEQLVAPIALYPDALVAQVLMASTYPLEIVQAARWSSTNPKVKGAALENAMQKQIWDASVKSLTAFPEVLRMMNDKLDWTQQLGNAFLAQQEAVLAAVQTLRLRAMKAGNLKSTKQHKVATSTGSNSKTYVVIQPTNPEVVYVPVYNPTVVYGTWPYPAYPPYAYYPPGYAARGAFWFATGVAVGSALWGNCNWGRYNVNINVNRFNQFNRTNITSNRWQHNSVHRKGVPYANRNVAQRYGRSPQNIQSREQFRGRAQAGRKQLSQPSTQAAARRAATGQSPHTAGRSPGRASPRQSATRRSPTQQRSTTPARSRPGYTPGRGSAYGGVGSGRQARSYSSRGRSSRSTFQHRGGGVQGRGGGGFRGGRRR